MRDCPQCGKPVDGSQCVQCGYSENSVKQKRQARVVLCAFQELGQQCAEFGTLTENTRGGNAMEPHPGPWYCRTHFPPFSGRRFGLKAMPPPQGFLRLKSTLHPIAHDVEAIAERAALQADQS